MPRLSATHAPDSLRQRAELTFKQNRQHGRHGWLRLTPAYSVRLVEQILDEHPDASVVFDPFSGTGTTALCAAYRGKVGIATDINPFLIWFANAKAAVYDAASLASCVDAAQLAVRAALHPEAPRAEPPPLSNIERWWSPAALTFLLRLKAAIDVYDATLLQVAFCRTQMRLSNAAFNHQSMSFKPAATVPAETVPADTAFADAALADAAMADAAMAREFLADVAQVTAAAADNPTGSARYDLCDARHGLAEWRGRVDLLITSPPYPNRMSYIRELRPYMYWLGFLVSGRQAGELDWTAIGGTWGLATSRLAQWVPKCGFMPAGLAAALQSIQSAHAKNGRLLANYVHKYFEDMFEHLCSTLPLLKSGATAHYIVGNSIFYGHAVPAERFLAEQLAHVGLCDVSIAAIRKRNSKKGLIEYRVSGRKS